MPRSPAGGCKALETFSSRRREEADRTDLNPHSYIGGHKLNFDFKLFAFL
jgi:hypothetical protein